MVPGGLSVDNNLLTFHDMCEQLVAARYQLRALYDRVNAYRRSHPLPVRRAATCHQGQGG